MKTDFAAPWSGSLKMTTAVVLVVLGMAASEGGPRASFIVAVILGCALFAVRGYRIEKGALRVLRVGWSTRFALDSLEGAIVDGQAMGGSIRAFGMAGAFAHVGRYWNARLGWYSVYATDPERAVVLTFHGRRVVVTPDDPQRFAAALMTAATPRDR